MKTRTTVIGMIKFEDKVLLLKRSLSKETSPGKWHFVSGSIKEKEYCEDAAIREVKEETNLDAEIISKGKILEVMNYYGRWIVIPYLCEVENKDLLKLSEENAEFAWIKPEEWKKYDCMEGTEDELKNVGLL